MMLNSRTSKLVRRIL